MTQILAQLPGTFYIKPAPDAQPFKAAGDRVEINDTIGIIEVMKTFIEVKAEVAGTFSGYLAEDALPVAPGQPLAEVV